MDRRLKAYREYNRSDVQNPCLTDFFSQYNIPFFNQLSSDPVEKVFEAFKIFIEKGGKPFNYMTFDEQKEQNRLMEKDKSQTAQEENKKEASEKEEHLEKEIRSQKD
jgi:hypothetical protein